MDGDGELLFGFSFLLNLLVIGGLWWAIRYETLDRPFWRSLAIGWTLSLVANVLWIAYDVITGSSLPPLSAVDGLYLARYVIVWLAFWWYPEPLRQRQGWGMIGVMAVGAVVAWMGHYRLVWRSTNVALPDFLGVTVYPILDVGLTYSGAIRAQATEERPSCGLKWMVVGSLVMYGIANWLNFNLRMGLLDPMSPWPTVFWMVCDLGVGMAVVGYLMSQREE